MRNTTAIVKRNHIRPIDMMPEMFLAYFFLSTITTAGKPHQDASQLGIPFIIGKNRVVRAFMNHIRGNHHTMRQQHDTQGTKKNTAAENQSPTGKITA